MLIKKLETEAEIDGKAFVHCRAWKEAYDGLLDASFLAGRTVEFSRQRARKAFADGILTLIAVDGERVVGFVGYGPASGEEGTGEIFALYVLEEYQRRGIGYALMREALSRLEGCRVVVLWALKENDKAIRFYERVGFRPDGGEKEITLGAPVKGIRMAMER